MLGVDAISHKKKARFWRTIADSFPQLIDFLCEPNDLGQVVLSFTSGLMVFKSTLGLQRELVTGLDGFYRAYISSEADTRSMDADDATFAASLFSSIRFELRGAVRHCIQTLALNEPGLSKRTD